MDVPGAQRDILILLSSPL